MRLEIATCAECDSLDAEVETDDIGSLKAELMSTPEGRAALRRARHCRQCGIHAHGRETRRLCGAATCTVWQCPSCGMDRGSVGPIDCKVCNWAPWWIRLLWAPATVWYWLASRVRSR